MSLFCDTLFPKAKPECEELVNQLEESLKSGDLEKDVREFTGALGDIKNMSNELKGLSKDAEELSQISGGAQKLASALKDAPQKLELSFLLIFVLLGIVLILLIVITVMIGIRCKQP